MGPSKVLLGILVCAIFAVLLVASTIEDEVNKRPPVVPTVPAMSYDQKEAFTSGVQAIQLGILPTANPFVGGPRFDLAHYWLLGYMSVKKGVTPE